MARPKIGPRTELTARVPPDLHDAVRAEADRRGIPISKLVIELLEEKRQTAWPAVPAEASQVA